MTLRRALLPGGLGLGLGASATAGLATPLLILIAAALTLASLSIPALALASVGIAQLSPAALDLPGLPAISGTKLAGGLLLASVLLSGRGARLLERTPLDVPMLLVGLAMAITAWWSPVPTRAATSALSAWLLLALVRLSHAALAHPGDLRLVTRTLTIALCALCLASLTHHLTLLSWGVPPDAWALRSAGAMADPNLWAASLVIWGPVLLAGLRQESRLVRLLGGVALLTLLPTALWITGSRAGLLAWILTLPGQAWALRLSPRVLLTVFCGTSITLSLLRPDLGPRLIALTDPSLEVALGEGALRDRVNLLHTGLALLPQALPLGLGLGASLRESAVLTAGDTWKVLHNTPLTVLVEQGTFGAAALAMLVFAALRDLWRKAAHPVAAGLLAAAPGLAFLSLTLDLLHFGPMWLLLGIGLACPESSQPPRRLPMG